MALVQEVSFNPSVLSNAGTLVPGFATTFRSSINAFVGTVEDKAQLAHAYLEQVFAQLGYGAIAGGTIAIGTGLSVTVTAATAVVGGFVRTDASSTVAVTASTTNYIWARQDGNFTASTALTPPGTSDAHGTSVLWGSAVANSTAVTAVYNERAYFGPGGAGAHQGYSTAAVSSGTVTVGTQRFILTNTSGSVIVIVPMPTPNAQPVYVKNLGAGTTYVSVGTWGTVGGGSIEGAGTIQVGGANTSAHLMAFGTVSWYKVAS